MIRIHGNKIDDVCPGMQVLLITADAGGDQFDTHCLVQPLSISLLPKTLS